MDEDSPSLLGLILDLDPLAWARIADRANTDENLVAKYLESMLVFMDTHLLMNERNRVAAIARGFDSIRVLYPPADSPDEFTEGKDEGNLLLPHAMIKRFKEVVVEGSRTFFSEGTRKMMESGQNNLENQQEISPAISLALCMMNRVLKDYASPTSDKDKSAGGGAKGSEACHLTGGLYLKLDNLGASNYDSLPQYLIDSFLPANSTREVLNLPERKEVDFRASCFATRKVISTGYTCSVCLATFSKRIPECDVCSTRFMEVSELQNQPRKPQLAGPPRAKPTLAQPPKKATPPKIATPPNMAQPPNPAAARSKPTMALPPRIATPPNKAQPPNSKPPMAPPPKLATPPNLAQPPKLAQRPKLAPPPKLANPPKKG